MTVLLVEFGVDANVAYDLELGKVQLMVANVDVAAEGEAGGIIIGREGVKVAFKGVVDAKDEEWVTVEKAEFMEGTLVDVSMWFGSGEDSAKHIVDVWGVVGGLHVDFLGGDEVHGCSAAVWIRLFPSQICLNSSTSGLSTSVCYVDGCDCACCSFPHLLAPGGIKGLINAMSDHETNSATREINTTRLMPWLLDMRDQIWNDMLLLHFKMKKEMRGYFVFLEKFVARTMADELYDTVMK